MEAAGRQSRVSPHCLHPADHVALRDLDFVRRFFSHVCAPLTASSMAGPNGTVGRFGRTGTLYFAPQFQAVRLWKRQLRECRGAKVCNLFTLSGGVGSQRRGCAFALGGLQGSGRCPGPNDTPNSLRLSFSEGEAAKNLLFFQSRSFALLRITHTRKRAVNKNEKACERRSRVIGRVAQTSAVHVCGSSEACSLAFQFAVVGP